MPRIAPRKYTGGPRCSWSSGKPIGTSYYVGLFIDRGLDHDLDIAATDAGWTAADIAHGDGRIAPHWLPPNPAWAYVLIDGVPWRDMAGMTVNSVSQHGIGARWPQGQSSALAVQLLFRDLLDVGFREPIPFAVTSRTTESLLAVLVDHNDMLDRYEAAMRARHTPQAVEYWQVALPIAPGEQERRGSGNKMSTAYRVGHAHPSPPTLGYFRANLASAEVSSIWQARREAICAWAARYAAQTGGYDG